MYKGKDVVRVTDPFHDEPYMPWRVRVYARVVTEALENELYDMVGEVGDVVYTDPLERTPGLDDLYELGEIATFDVVLNPITVASNMGADMAGARVRMACEEWAQKVYAAKEEQ